MAAYDVAPTLYELRGDASKSLSEKTDTANDRREFLNAI